MMKTSRAPLNAVSPLRNCGIRFTRHTFRQSWTRIDKKSNPDAKPGEWRKNMIKFLDLFNTMHCDFFEIQKGRKSELVEWEMSGKMLQTCKKYFDDWVIDFYITRSNKNNELGLVIRLEEIKK